MPSPEYYAGPLRRTGAWNLESLRTYSACPPAFFWQDRRVVRVLTDGKGFNSTATAKTMHPPHQFVDQARDALNHQTRVSMEQSWQPIMKIERGNG